MASLDAPTFSSPLVERGRELLTLTHPTRRVYEVAQGLTLLLHPERRAGRVLAIQVGIIGAFCDACGRYIPTGTLHAHSRAAA